MKMMSSITLNTVAPWGCNAWAREPTTETFRRGFELCVVARDAANGNVSAVASSTGDTVLINLPAALSSSDLKRVRAITKSSWYVLSGSHRTSTLLLKLKPSASARFQATLGGVISHGDQVAMLLNGEVIGMLLFQRQLTGEEIAIDASFFSEGTEKEKETVTRSLARQISSTLY